jgi:hypothetical protein
VLACRPVTDSTLPPTASDDYTVCFKCKRKTSVKAVLPVGSLVYLRCDECGSAWSIVERRTVPRKAPKDTTPR